MKQYKLYIVGGYVRDKLLGIKSKDIDYAFEFTKENGAEAMSNWAPEACYNRMNAILKTEGFEIFLETPSCFTTRARFPKGHEYEGTTADFVMCRKESYPNCETRIPIVKMGTLYDDLQRRDFTINAIAIDPETGDYIDPFNGIKDLKDKILKCPIDATTSFNDDPLRAIRALRFKLTKGLSLSDDVFQALNDFRMWNKFETVVSRERVREELMRMFKFNTFEALRTFNYVPYVTVTETIFKNDIWLKPSMEHR